MQTTELKNEIQPYSQKTTTVLVGKPEIKRETNFPTSVLVVSILKWEPDYSTENTNGPFKTN